MYKLVFGFLLTLSCVRGLDRKGFSEDISGENLVFPGFEKEKLEDTDYNEITEKNLTFRLYTRENKESGIILPFGDRKKLVVSGFNGRKPTILVTHGFRGDGFTKFIGDIKNEILKVENVNYISVDWSPCAKNIRYDLVVRCMKTSGKYTGKFLKFLQEEGKVNVNKMHLIGHSLGAHLMGFAAKEFGPKVIGRISGLDPAGPLFEEVDESERLNPNSAKFVDVIHTCRIFTGIKKPVGTVDFYPNGGYNQPNCLKADMLCHHNYSTIYYARSIASKSSFTSTKCPSLDDAIDGTCNGQQGTMGYYSFDSTPGLYYLKITK